MCNNVQDVAIMSHKSLFVAYHKHQWLTLTKGLLANVALVRAVLEVHAAVVIHHRLPKAEHPLAYRTLIWFLARMCSHMQI